MPVVEASVVAGMVIAWAVRKARHAAGRADETVDAAIDMGADRLHEVVLAKLGVPVQEDLAQEAAGESGLVSELTRQQVELAVAAAARRDEEFAQTVTDLVARLQDAQRAAGTQILAAPGSAVFTGGVTATAHDEATAIGQAGTVHIGRGDRGGEPDPRVPGRSGH
ncbi:chromosome partitioning protein [Actinoplanes sp. NPDC051494]|uniref:chromosome partitioning protein n=1 Tax=Actinoplanes sp. NPDC051494 TaxID=3363907 RepID=UPI0037B918D5